MEAKKVRKGVGIRFAPVRRLLDMQTTKRLQRSLASYFFPPLPTFPIPLGVEWKLENGSSVSGIPDSKFHEGEEEEQEEGIGNDVSPKVTDQPEFCRFLWISCVSAAKKFCSSKRNDYPRFIIVIIFLEIDKIFLDQCGTTVWTIIVPKLIVVNWCADEIISAPRSAINGSTANFLPLRNTIRVIYIRLRSRKFLVNEFFHRYLSVKWINRFDVWIRSYLRITRFRDRYDRYVAILRIVCSVSIFLPFSFFFILSR